MSEREEREHPSMLRKRATDEKPVELHHVEAEPHDSAATARGHAERKTKHERRS